MAFRIRDLEKFGEKNPVDHGKQRGTRKGSISFFYNRGIFWFQFPNSFSSLLRCFPSLAARGQEGAVMKFLGGTVVRGPSLSQGKTESVVCDPAGGSLLAPRPGQARPPQGTKASVQLSVS